MEISATMLY